MILSLETFAAGGFLAFCRVGGCIMTLPGFSSERVPVRVRLYIAVALTAVIAAQLWSSLEKIVHGAPLGAIVAAAVGETLVGALIGLTCRLFLYAVETMLTAVTMTIGLGNSLGAPINEAEPTPAMASLIVIGATTLIFILDLHLELIRGLRQSYDVISVAVAPSAEAMLLEVVKSLDHAYLVVFRICSPFLLFGLIVNVAVGLLNKMAPQVPIYFVSTPLLIVLGVYWLYFLSPDALANLSDEFGAWLAKG